MHGVAQFKSLDPKTPMINFTPSNNSPKWIGYIFIYLPFILSVLICGGVLQAGIKIASPVFFANLPLVFLFVAISTNTQIIRLENRINDLEAKLSDAKKV